MSNFPIRAGELPDILPCCIYAPGTQAFDICTVLDIAWEFGPPLTAYMQANPDFKREGWGRVAFKRLHVCAKGRRHWKIERAT